MVGRPRYSQLQVRLANREILLPKSMSEFLVIKIYSFGFNILMSDSPKLLRTTQGTIWVVHWATQDFSLAAALVHAWCYVSEWHKFGIAIVFREPDNCWGTRDSKAASVDRSVTGPTIATMNLAFPIRLLASAFILLLASAFIFLLSHLKLITLPMHSPTNTRHNITSKDKFGTGTPHLADMPTAVHRQNSWKITGWSHGTVSMAMHCLGYNKLTPDGSLANHIFDAAVAVAVFDTGSEAFFFRIRHTAPLCTPWDHSCLNFTNDKCNTQAIGFRTTHVTAPSSDDT